MGSRQVICGVTSDGKTEVPLLVEANGGLTIGGVTLEGGDASAANQATQITAANLTNTRVGDVEESAPGTDTASSGLNGRLQRIAQRLTSLIALLPSSLGIKTAANSLSVAPASDATFSTGGYVANPTANFTRPADTTAYASGDLVANNTVGASVAAMTLTVGRVAAGSAMIRRLKLHKSSTSVTSASFRVHLFRSPPETVTNGDNGAFSVSGVADYLGAWDVTIDRAFTDGAAGYGTPVKGNDQSIKLASGTDIRALIEARAAYTPASEEVFTVSLDCLQN
jgi:hypothetical protein